MKETELRIGNYILFEPINGMGYEQIQVAELPFKKQNNVNPIPLTEEWLLKFGCNYSVIDEKKLNYWNKDLDFSVDVEKHGNELLFRYLICGQERTKSIIYVHQLQNLHFALKETELTEI